MGCKGNDSKEAIHSGHFMISHFEAEAQDDEENVLVEIPDDFSEHEAEGTSSTPHSKKFSSASNNRSTTAANIDVSFAKLFNAMSLAYRQKITSPKWNRFKGLKLRWKDKIRLNNVIWRCWHMQFILKKNMNVCQFSLDVDTHNKPEAIVLEGKYWKRRLQAVTAEYKKWRMFSKNRHLGQDHRIDLDQFCITIMDRSDSCDEWRKKAMFGLDEMDWSKDFSSFGDFKDPESQDFTDFLFSSISNPLQPYAFPNPREIARGTENSDLLQPGLVQLQPNLEEFMDIQEMLGVRGLPTLPEEDLFTEVTEPSVQHRNSEPVVPEAASTFQFSSSPLHTPHPPTFPPQETFPHAEKAPDEYMSPLQSDIQQQKAFLRSHSQQELNIPSSGKDFAVPKVYPRRRSLSSGPSAATGLDTLASAAINSSLLNAMPTPFISVASTSAEPGFAPFYGVPSCDTSHFPSSVTVCTSPAVASSSIEMPSHFAAAASSSNSFSSSYSAKNSNCLFDSTLIGKAPSNNIHKLFVVDAISQAASHCSATLSLNSVTARSSSSGRLPPLTLSAVTPSSIKSVQMAPPSLGSPQRIIKTSPHSEPTSPLIASVPSPSNKPYRPKSDMERVHYKEHRRVCHINAEQKRRCNIKSNFDTLHMLIPSINQNPNAKISKAAMLHKGADYIHQLKVERQQLTEQAEKCRAEIEKLSNDISNAQALLPATGAPMSHSRHNKLNEMYRRYVHDGSLNNWKFWIFSLIMQPLFESFNNTVSTASVDDLCRSAFSWLDQHCSLIVLRPVVSNSMRKLCTSTNILTSPDTLPNEIYQNIIKKEKVWSPR